MALWIFVSCTVVAIIEHRMGCYNFRTGIFMPDDFGQDRVCRVLRCGRSVLLGQDLERFSCCVNGGGALDHDLNTYDLLLWG